MEIYERIESIMKLKGLNYRSLGIKLGYSDTQTRNIVLGKSIPKIDFIQNLLRVFPDINISWLLKGEGSILNTIEKNEDRSNNDISIKISLSEDEINKIVDGVLFHETQLLENSTFKKWLDLKLVNRENEILTKISNMKKNEST